MTISVFYHLIVGHYREVCPLVNYCCKEIFQLMKLGPKPKNWFKIACLECGVPMNNDHWTKHNLLFHAEMLKQHKVIRWESLNAPKNAFETGATRVSGMEEAPSASTNTTPVPDSMATINDRLLRDSGNMKHPLRHLLKHVESRFQPPKSQQLLVRSRVNRETQNVSWTVEKTQERSDHAGLIMMNGRPGCTTTNRRMLHSVSPASKPSSKF